MHLLYFSPWCTLASVNWYNALALAQCSFLSMSSALRTLVGDVARRIRGSSGDEDSRLTLKADAISTSSV